VPLLSLEKGDSRFLRSRILYLLYSTNYFGFQRAGGLAPCGTQDTQCHSSIASPLGRTCACCVSSQCERNFLARPAGHCTTLSRTNYCRRKWRTFFHWSVHCLLSATSMATALAVSLVGTLACTGGKRPSTLCETSQARCSSTRWPRACAKFPWWCHLHESSANSSSSKAESWLGI